MIEIFFKKYFNFQGFYIIYIIIWQLLWWKKFTPSKLGKIGLQKMQNGEFFFGEKHGKLAHGLNFAPKIIPASKYWYAMKLWYEINDWIENWIKIQHLYENCICISSVWSEKLQLVVVVWWRIGKGRTFSFGTIVYNYLQYGFPSESSKVSRINLGNS